MLIEKFQENSENGGQAEDSNDVKNESGGPKKDSVTVKVLILSIMITIAMHLLIIPVIQMAVVPFNCEVL